MSDKGRTRLVEDWYRFAAEDLAAAKELHHERDYFFHQTSLLCQQSAEKYLKAYLLSQGWKLAKTHELSRLVSECLTYDESFEALYPPCELLNGYIITGRYPGDLPFESTTKDDAKRAIDAALEVEVFVLGKRNQPTAEGKGE
jgi:HEPN domain-containing protein